MAKYAHDLTDFTDLCRFISKEKGGIPEQLVEKDYWIMHCLWGLEQLKFNFHMKGGTSLSKGWNLLERFSEDIDIKIMPESGDDISIGRNHDKPKHIQKRTNFFNDLVTKIKIDGIVEVVRDPLFDDQKMRNAGIYLKYKPHFEEIPGVKPGILLEVGFDQTTPNEPKDISSWVYDTLAGDKDIEIIDNRAKQVKCYYPEYTFVEKLQALSTKYRQEQESGELKVNQLRHYYDIDCLLKSERVQTFIGSKEYKEHKGKRFRAKDETDLTKNEAFILSSEDARKKYVAGFQSISSLFYGETPQLEKIIENLKPWLSKL